MHTATKSVLAALVVLLFAVNPITNLTAGENHGMDQAAMHKAWMDFATPTAAHKSMMTTVGEWTTVTKSWMGGPDPVVSEGTASYKMVMGDRYLEGMHSTPMEFGVLDGRSVMAYDNAQKKYFSTWIDNMGTGLTVMEGNFDAASKTFKMTGTMSSPMSSEPMPIRSELTIISKDKSTFTMWGTMGGQEVKMMEMTYTRA